MKCALFLFKLVTAKQHLALNTGLLFWYTLFPCVWSVLINARLSHLSPPPPPSLEYPNTSKDSVEADQHSKLRMTFTLLNQINSEPVVVHQVTISTMYTHSGTFWYFHFSPCYLLKLAFNFEAQWLELCEFTIIATSPPGICTPDFWSAGDILCSHSRQ